MKRFLSLMLCLCLFCIGPIGLRSSEAFSGDVLIDTIIEVFAHMPSKRMSDCFQICQ